MESSAFIFRDKKLIVGSPETTFLILIRVLFGVLGAMPLTSEFGRQNSVLATTQDSSFSKGTSASSCKIEKAESFCTPPVLLLQFAVKL